MAGFRAPIPSPGGARLPPIQTRAEMLVPSPASAIVARRRQGPRAKAATPLSLKETGSPSENQISPSGLAFSVTFAPSNSPQAQKVPVPPCQSIAVELPLAVASLKNLAMSLSLDPVTEAKFHTGATQGG